MLLDNRIHADLWIFTHNMEARLMIPIMHIAWGLRKARLAAKRRDQQKLDDQDHEEARLLQHEDLRVCAWAHAQ